MSSKAYSRKSRKQTANQKPSTKPKKEVANRLFADIDDASSEASGGGLIFLKKNRAASLIKTKTPQLSADENDEFDESTDNLLVPFTASIVPKRSSLKTPEHPSTPGSEKRVTIMDDKTRSATNPDASGSRSLRMLSPIHKVYSLDNMFFIQEGGDGGLRPLSIASLDVDSSLKNASSVSMCSQGTPDSVQVFKESLEDNSIHVENISSAKTHASSSRMARSSEDSRDRSISGTLNVCDSTFPSHVTQTTDYSSTEPVEDIDQYSDDFESEDELPKQPPVSKTSSDRLRNSTGTGVKFNLAVEPLNLRSFQPTTLEHFCYLRVWCTKCPSSAQMKMKQRSVEVQTNWIDGPGMKLLDSTLCFAPFTSCRPPCTINTADVPALLAYEAFQPRPIANLVVDDKAIDTFTGLNPCLRALDNMLRQQVQITREFLSTQQQLHQTLSAAISRCLTTEYPTWENTMRLLKASHPR
ncbi:hypothetical protein PHET_07490 [Paragonimus heterotremus]|uniref:DUF4614 domain-containing protein n=1 Tax=Paragonimus heterotremus TaxID=100268 RepID=A0A8J4WWN5_9TREM|nr:hypothetical protein PHET_07490 [Paragonimus heterotremus]